VPYRKLYFVAALVGVLVLGFIATSVIGYYVARDSLDQRISSETLPLTSDNVYSEIEQDLLRSVLIASLMAHDTFLRDWTLAGEEDRASILRYLAEIQNKYDTTTAFFVSEKTRRYYHPHGVLRRVERGEPLDAWYFRVREMDEPYEINIDFDTARPDRLTIFVNYRVRDYDGNYLGATGIGLAVDSVAELINSYEQRYGRRIFFIDREGTVQLRGESYDGPARIREHPGLETVATKILSSQSATARYTDADGRTVHVNSRLIPEFGWYLIVEQSGSATNSRILNTLFLNIVVALVFAAIALVTAWFTVRGYQVRLEEMATRDELSGAASRQVFSSLFEQVARMGRRSGSPISLVALDIDAFKQVNDKFGHAAGDAVIRMLAGTINEHVRDVDTLCRWGGDEFLILLGDCALDDAVAIAEKIRTAVAARGIRHAGHDLAVTVSAGVVQHDRNEGLEALVARADAALYRSKNGGRNHVSTG
jgi:diguanylate cyclase (GGDEF)-like protein